MTEQIDVDDFLEHVGVKGMKWGQRKAEGGVETAGGGGGGGGKISPEVKAARKDARKAGRQDHFNKRREFLLKDNGDGTQSVSGRKVATTILADYGSLGAFSAARSARASGASKGKAVAIGYLTGPPGAAIYSEIKIRKAVNAAIN